MANATSVDNNLLRQQARKQRAQEAQKWMHKDSRPQPLFGPPIPRKPRPDDRLYQLSNSVLGNYEEAKSLVYSSSSVGVFYQPMTPVCLASGPNPFPEPPAPAAANTTTSKAEEISVRVNGSHKPKAPKPGLNRQGVFDKFGLSDTLAQGSDSEKCGRANNEKVARTDSEMGGAGDASHSEAGEASQRRSKDTHKRTGHREKSRDRSRSASRSSGQHDRGHSSKSSHHGNHSRKESSGGSHSHSISSAATTAEQQHKSHKSSVKHRARRSSPSPEHRERHHSESSIHSNASTSSSTSGQPPDVAHSPTSKSSHDDSPKKSFRPPNGLVNGLVKRDLDRSRTASESLPKCLKLPKLNLPTKGDGAVSEDHVEEVLKEMSLHPPLTAIHTPRKEETARFPFSLSCKDTTDQQAKLKRQSNEKVTTGRGRRISSTDGSVKGLDISTDLVISSDSEAEDQVPIPSKGPGDVQRHNRNAKAAEDCGKMSDSSDSSSDNSSSEDSDSEVSSSGAEEEEEPKVEVKREPEQTKPHPKPLLEQAKTEEEEDEKPKWNLENWIRLTSQPSLLPVSSPPKTSQESAESKHNYDDELSSCVKDILLTDELWRVKKLSPLPDLLDHALETTEPQDDSPSSKVKMGGTNGLTMTFSLKNSDSAKVQSDSYMSSPPGGAAVSKVKTEPYTSGADNQYNKSASGHASKSCVRNGAHSQTTTKSPSRRSRARSSTPKTADSLAPADDHRPTVVKRENSPRTATPNNRSSCNNTSTSSSCSNSSSRSHHHHSGKSTSGATRSAKTSPRTDKTPGLHHSNSKVHRRTPRKSPKSKEFISPSLSSDSCSEDEGKDEDSSFIDVETVSSPEKERTSSTPKSDRGSRKSSDTPTRSRASSGHTPRGGSTVVATSALHASNVSNSSGTSIDLKDVFDAVSAPKKMLSPIPNIDLLSVPVTVSSVTVATTTRTSSLSDSTMATTSLARATPNSATSCLGVTYVDGRRCVMVSLDLALLDKYSVKPSLDEDVEMCASQPDSHLYVSQSECPSQQEDAAKPELRIKSPLKPEVDEAKEVIPIETDIVEKTCQADDAPPAEAKDNGPSAKSISEKQASEILAKLFPSEKKKPPTIKIPKRKPQDSSSHRESHKRQRTETRDSNLRNNAEDSTSKYGSSATEEEVDAQPSHRTKDSHDTDLTSRFSHRDARKPRHDRDRERDRRRDWERGRDRDRHRRRDWDAPETSNGITENHFDSSSPIGTNGESQKSSQNSSQNIGSQWGAMATGHMDPVYENRREENTAIVMPQPRRRVEPVEFKLLPAALYLEEARRLKHEADSLSDHVLKCMKYMGAVCSFIQHGLAMEHENAIDPQKIFKMYNETLRLVRFIFSRKERNATADVMDKEKKLIVLGLRLQSYLCFKLFKVRKPEAAKLKKIIDEQNKSGPKPVVQAPSPYQTTTTNAGSGHNWNRTTSSPLSPQPSPANSVGSVGSVGSMGSGNGEHGVSKMMNGNVNCSSQSVTSAVNVSITQRIHSITQQYLSHMNYLFQCHDIWDQADALALEHKDFFKDLDKDCGALTFQSQVPEIVRYVKEGLNRLKDT